MVIFPRSVQQVLQNQRKACKVLSINRIPSISKSFVAFYAITILIITFYIIHKNKLEYSSQNQATIHLKIFFSFKIKN